MSTREPRAREAPILRKACNCLILDAKASLARYATAAALLGVDLAAVEAMLHRFRARYGGLWVGGSIELTAQALTFRPNALNLAVHTEDYSFSVPLDDITAVQHSWGFVTGVVTVSTSRGHFKLRCFGARRLRDAVDLARAEMEGQRAP